MRCCGIPIKVVTHTGWSSVNRFGSRGIFRHFLARREEAVTFRWMENPGENEKTVSLKKTCNNRSVFWIVPIIALNVTAPVGAPRSGSVTTKYKHPLPAMPD